MSRRKEAIELRNTGLTYAEIGRRLDISKQRAFDLIKGKPRPKSAPGPNGMLTGNDVAHLLNVHINTVRRWANQGLLKSYRIGPRGDRRFRREDVKRFLKGGELTDVRT